MGSHFHRRSRARHHGFVARRRVFAVLAAHCGSASHQGAADVFGVCTDAVPMAHRPPASQQSSAHSNRILDLSLGLGSHLHLYGLDEAFWTAFHGRTAFSYRHPKYARRTMQSANVLPHVAIGSATGNLLRPVLTGHDCNTLYMWVPFSGAYTMSPELLDVVGFDAITARSTPLGLRMGAIIMVVNVGLEAFRMVRLLRWWLIGRDTELVHSTSAGARGRGLRRIASMLRE